MFPVFDMVKYAGLLNLYPKNLNIIVIVLYILLSCRSVMLGIA